MVSMVEQRMARNIIKSVVHSLRGSKKEAEKHSEPKNIDTSIKWAAEYLTKCTR